MIENPAVTVTIPLRLDIGGTWDLKAFGLLFEDRAPATVNIALDLPISILLKRREDDLICISDPYNCVSTTIGQIHFRSEFGLILAICTHLGYKGFSAEIEYTVPPRSGLGGSGALAAGFIAGMQFLMNDQDGLYYKIAQTVHEVEEGLRFSYCGYQDQCAALYGGVNKWLWTYSEDDKYERIQLLSQAHYKDLTDRLVLAYLGKGHTFDVNQKQMESFFSPRTRGLWFRINENTHLAAESIQKMDWDSLAECIQIENNIRISLVPERLAPEAIKLMDLACDHGAGFGIAGAGAGGCVFCFAPDVNKAQEIASSWEHELKSVENGRLIANPAVSLGIKCDYQDSYYSPLYEAQHDLHLRE